MIKEVKEMHEIIDHFKKNQLKWDLRFLELAKTISSWSKDPSTKTGAVIVRPDRTIVSVGYNGFPKNMDDKEEDYNNREVKYSKIIHCEVNAVLFAERKSLFNSTLYTYPFMSCDRCFVQMIQAGINRFVAPKATSEQLERWGSAFEKVRNYAKEANVELIELDFLPLYLISNEIDNKCIYCHKKAKDNEFLFSVNAPGTYWQHWNYETNTGCKENSKNINPSGEKCLR